GAAVGARAVGIAQPVARDGAQGNRSAGRAGTGRAASRLGQLHRTPARTALVAPDQLFRGTAPARLHAFVTLARPRLHGRPAPRAALARLVTGGARPAARAAGPCRK